MEDVVAVHGGPLEGIRDAPPGLQEKKERLQSKQAGDNGKQIFVETTLESLRIWSCIFFQNLHGLETCGLQKERRPISPVSQESER